MTARELRIGICVRNAAWSYARAQWRAYLCGQARALSPQFVDTVLRLWREMQR